MAAKKSQPQTIKKSSTRSARRSRVTPWRNDLGIGYATYDHEADYVSPTAIGIAQSNALKRFHQRLATSPVFTDDAP